ncbi:MOSC domain-containing protein [Methylomonas sp. MgM2]
MNNNDGPNLNAAATGRRQPTRQTEARIRSVNVSRVTNVIFKGKTVPTGIFKRPVEGLVHIGVAGAADDEQADLRCHGGPHKAVYIYGLPGYAHWETYLGRKLAPGSFGENLTVDSLTEDDVRIGDLLICGKLVIQISEPRISCFKLAMTLNEDPGFSKIFLEDGRVGFYARVLQEGSVMAGDCAIHEPVAVPSPTIREFVRACYDPNASLADLKFARNATGLSPEWRALLDKRASSLMLARQGLAWPGFKRFTVAQRETEAAGIVSLYLVPEDGSALPGYLPGQHVAVCADLPGSGKLTRTYSLSSGQAFANAFRITVKRMPLADGQNESASLSHFLHDSIKVGDLVQVKAPGGRFFIDETDDSPRVLLAGGVGITPLYAMFEQAAAAHCATTLVYAVRDESERCFRPAIEALCNQHSHLKAVFLAESGIETSLPGNTRPGRIDDDLLAELDTDTANFFLCGPLGFPDQVEAMLQQAGVSESRIRVEAFAARSANAIRFTPAATGAEHTVTFEKSGFSVQWTAEQGTLLDLAEACGLRPPFACRAGTCQSCATTLVSGSVDYLELVDPPSPQQTFICCTIPVSDLVLDL